MPSEISAPVPDARGHFGPYGGRFVPETLVSALEELEQEYQSARTDPEFRREFSSLLGRLLRASNASLFRGAPDPAPWRSKNLSQARGPFAHRRAQKSTNAIGQAILCKRMGKKRVIAETGAGQHGVATATAAARFRLRMRCLHGRSGHEAPGCSTSRGWNFWARESSP